MRSVRVRPGIWKGNAKLQCDWRIEALVPDAKIEAEATGFLQRLSALLEEEEKSEHIRVDVVDETTREVLREGACMLKKGEDPIGRVKVLSDGVRQARGADG